MSLVTIGCDPELMIADKKSGALISAIGIIPGDKHSPHPLEDGACLPDNVNFEFNTKPANTKEEFSQSILKVLKQTIPMIGAGKVFLVQASADFPESELQHENAKAFGCDPDFDAWSVAINEVPAGAANLPFRSAGGHIHVGFTEKSKELLEDFDGKLRVIRALDAILGISCVLLDKDPTSAARRKLYGRAGCHRPKPYGVEYRSPGNFWVNSPELAELMFELSEFAVQFCLDGKDEALIGNIGRDILIETINDSKLNDAEKIFNLNIKPILPLGLADKIESLRKATPSLYESWKL